MGNIIRAEVSEKNPYWIEKHRHYELKHFCLQYPIWKKAYSSLNGMLSRREALNAFGKARHVSNPTERIAILKRKKGLHITAPLSFFAWTYLTSAAKLFNCISMCCLRSLTAAS